jgi:hypothetical protein
MPEIVGWLLTEASHSRYGAALRTAARALAKAADLPPPTT